MGLSEEEKIERGKVTEEIIVYDSTGADDYVFISYKSDDWEIVLKKVVRQMINQYGLKVYFDKNFNRSNESWINNMEQAIATKKCRAVLAFVSKKYMTSYACVMELLTARSQNTCMSFDKERYDKLQIIPIIIDNSGSVGGAASKSGQHISIEEEERFLKILENTKESPWVKNNDRLIPWLERLKDRQEWREENFSTVAEIILCESHYRIFSEDNSNFYEDLRQTIKKCSGDVFNPALIKRGIVKEERNGRIETAKAEDAGNKVKASYLEYWTEFQAYAQKMELRGGIRLSKAGDHNWYALWLDDSTFRIECSVNTRKETLRTAFFVQNAPARFIRLEQAKTAIEDALESEGKIAWDGKSQAANVSVFNSRQGKSKEEQYDWFCRTAEKLYAAVSPYLG